MSHPSKAKGSKFEREIVDAAKAAGFESRRAWGSNGQALGHGKDVDLEIGSTRVQAKRRRQLPAYLCIPSGCDAVVFRQDKGKPLAMIPFDRYLELLGFQCDKPDDESKPDA